MAWLILMWGVITGLAYTVASFYPPPPPASLVTKLAGDAHNVVSCHNWPDSHCPHITLWSVTACLTHTVLHIKLWAVITGLTYTVTSICSPINHHLHIWNTGSHKVQFWDQYCLSCKPNLCQLALITPACYMKVSQMTHSYRGQVKCQISNKW